MVDVDGVLIRGRPSDQRPWHTKLEADLGVSYARLQQVFFEPHWADVVTGRVPIRKPLGSALASIAPRLSIDDFLQYWFSMDSSVDKALLGALRVARDRGLSLHLATNQEHERASYLWKHIGLAAHFDAIHFSAQLGVTKPDSLFFDAVLARAKFAAEEILLIDDTPVNVSEAKRAGWHALLWSGQYEFAALLDADF
jgi:putative hydrolase of the HAD superfamily